MTNEQIITALQAGGDAVAQDDWTFSCEVDNSPLLPDVVIRGEWTNADGLVALGALQVDKEAKTALISLLRVEDAYQRTGLMKRIYATLPGILRDLGIEQLIVGSQLNPVVAEVNQRAGFEVNEKGQLAADVTGEASSVEAYGNS